MPAVLPTIDPVGAALNAVVRYLESRLPGVKVVRGWPEAQVELVQPMIAVSAMPEATVALCAPGQVDQKGAQWLSCLYRVGWLTFQGQMDIFCPTRAERDALVPKVENLWHNGLPFYSGLRVTSEDYYRRPVTVDFQRIGWKDDGDTAVAGMWRAVWDISASTDVVAPVTLPKLAHAYLQGVTIQGNVTITEPDFSIL